MKKESNAEFAPGVGAPLDGARGRRQATPLQDRSGWTLWLWVGAGFLFLGLLWTGMVIATRQADTRTVPLATQEAKP